MARCAICGNDRGNTTHRAKEMMFGTREASVYLECSSCGCVQRVGSSPDGASDYPSDYYALGGGEVRPRSGLIRGMKAARTSLALRLPPRVVEFAVCRGLLRAHIRWFARLGLTIRSSILDVGSGDGRLLAELWDEGFRDLTGVDPNAPADRELRP